MEEEYLIKVTFRYETDDYKQSYYLGQEYLDGISNSAKIPEPPEGAKEHGVDRVNAVEITVYKRVF